jgi:hypothetical protein
VWFPVSFLRPPIKLPEKSRALVEGSLWKHIVPEASLQILSFQDSSLRNQFPLELIAVSVWLITPAASSQPASRFSDAPSASSEPPSPQSVFSTANQTQTPAVIN